MRGLKVIQAPIGTLLVLPEAGIVELLPGKSVTVGNWVLGPAEYGGNVWPGILSLSSGFTGREATMVKAVAKTNRREDIFSCNI